MVNNQYKLIYFNNLKISYPEQRNILLFCFTNATSAIYAGRIYSALLGKELLVISEAGDSSGD